MRERFGKDQRNLASDLGASVSGYPVLPRWLAARKGIEVTHDFLAEFRDITGRINELIYRFDEADVVLQEALNYSLTRDRLGLEPASDETMDERIDLFGNTTGQADLFPDATPQPGRIVDFPAEARRRLLGMLAEAKGAERLPWSQKETETLQDSLSANGGLAT